MNITADPPSSHSRTLSASSGYSNNSLAPPPSNHGGPKSPSALSTNSSKSNRSPPFPGMGLPSSPRPSEPRTPLSPPMSAQSFGTFIDSEPSTPASPRQGSSWDGSTLVLLSPVASATPSAGEPAWQMMAPIQKPPKKRMSRRRVRPSLKKEISLDAALSSSYPATSAQPQIPKENCPPIEEETENKPEEEQKTQAAPLERLATRMKSLLRRRSDNSKKSEKKQRYYELDRVETTHWTEL